MFHNCIAFNQVILSIFNICYIKGVVYIFHI